MYYSAVHTAGRRLRGRSARTRSTGCCRWPPSPCPSEKLLEQLPALRERIDWFAEHYGDRLDALAEFDQPGPTGRRLMSVFGRRRLERMLPAAAGRGGVPLPPRHPRGLRAGTRAPARPRRRRAGWTTSPAESRTGMFGGNSNWRGPGLVPDELPDHQRPGPAGRLLRRRAHRGDARPAPGSGCGCWTSPARSATGWWPSSPRTRTAGARCSAATSGCRPTRTWHDQLLFHEYFHGDTGAGLGASHQTGWTALVADLITSRRFDALRRARPPLRRCAPMRVCRGPPTRSARPGTAGA